MRTIRPIIFRFLAGCLGILLLAIPEPASAAFYLRAEGRFLVLKNQISYHTSSDPAKAPSFGAISADPAHPAETATPSHWVRQKDLLYAGPPASAGLAAPTPTLLWAKFDLPDFPAPRRMLIDVGPWEQVDYYVVRDGRLVARLLAGTQRPWPERSLPVTMTPSLLHAGFVEVEALPGTRTTVYARLQNSNQLDRIDTLRFSLWNPEQVQAGQLRDRFFQGGFFGLLLVLLIYNLAQFLIDRRQTGYLYYALSLAAQAMANSLAYGLSTELLWPEHPTWEYAPALLAQPLYYWATAQFVRRYLDTPARFPKYDLWLRRSLAVPPLMVPVLLLAMLFHVYSLTVLTSIIAAAAVLCFAPVLAVAVRVAMRRDASARLFVAAVSIEGITSLVSLAPVVGLVPFTDLTFHLGQLGSAVGGILLSLGLGLRMRELRAELAAQQLEEAARQHAHEREKRELVEGQSRVLEARVVERTAAITAAHEELASAHGALELAHRDLQETQLQLIESEKMAAQAEKIAALGGLVVGMAHEINTPVGVGVTAASSLLGSAGDFAAKYGSGQMKKKDLESFVEEAESSSQIILSNLERAAGLIQTFKTISLEQSGEAKRRFKLRDLVDEVFAALRPQLEAAGVTWRVDCPVGQEFFSYAEVLSQILGHLASNSLLHAFPPGRTGTLTLEASATEQVLCLRFADDGVGIAQDVLGKIYDPFFTTKRGRGRTGLGLHIVHNQVTQAFRGSIECQSGPERGCLFILTLQMD